MENQSFLTFIENGIHRYGNLPALSDFQGKTFYYKDFAQEIDKLHEMYRAAGIQKGDKIAIAGRNSARWAIGFFSILSYGAVAVSILHEFDKDSIQYIVHHSDAVCFLVDQGIWNNLNSDNMPQLTSAFSLDSYGLLKSESEELRSFVENQDRFFAEKYANGFDYTKVSFRKDEPEELAVINYTSGTTSSPKGVMIPYRSLWSNMQFSITNLAFIKPGDDIVCMLLMAHTYGLAFEILNSISMGCHIHFLSKVPSPKIIIDAFAQAKPKLVLAVPLIIEKIVTKNVFPKLQKNPTRTLLKIPGINRLIHNKIHKSLLSVFGGNLHQLVIGGAALNQEVETFLRTIRFPYTVGYGMTECGPLISYSGWQEFKQKSVGRPVDRMEVRIDSSHPETEVGEIQVRGMNVMLGYYKNEQATQESFTSDGWMKTGDLGIMDADKFVFIKGRNKNMILGASGQNIYPEEIEDKINNYDCVSESLIIEQNGKIVALIFPDEEAMKKLGIAKEEYPAFFDKVVVELNQKLPVYSKIASYRLQETEFEKTPKRSIKRFLYQKQ